MSDLPLTIKNHWEILQEWDRDGVKLDAERETLDRLTNLFGLPIDGRVESVNYDSQSIGFNLFVDTDENDAKKQFSNTIFPRYNEDREKWFSYIVRAAVIKGRFRNIDYETFKEQEFSHEIRVAQDFAPILERRLIENDIFIDTIKNSVSGYKSFNFNQKYIDNILEMQETNPLVY